MRPISVARCQAAESASEAEGCCRKAALLSISLLPLYAACTAIAEESGAPPPVSLKLPAPGTSPYGRNNLKGGFQAGPIYRKRRTEALRCCRQFASCTRRLSESSTKS